MNCFYDMQTMFGSVCMFIQDLKTQDTPASSINPKHHPVLNAIPKPITDIQGRTKNQYHQHMVTNITYILLATNNCDLAFIGILSAILSGNSHKNPRG
mmetsp:Transcript_11393/g.21315  ORF Transcript_11393/g.21315 Transcript_11393/m.21315 type:complete len:98 (+) Transcript_11393:10-303(+)